MDIIKADELENLEKYPEIPKKKKPVAHESWDSLSDEEFNKILESLKNPVEVQKEVAAKIKVFLDKRIEDELSENRSLSESTRKWTNNLNSILSEIQRNLYGEKNLNLHVGISHSQIAQKIREHSQYTDTEQIKNEKTPKKKTKKRNPKMH